MVYLSNCLHIVVREIKPIEVGEKEASYDKKSDSQV